MKLDARAAAAFFCAACLSLAHARDPASSAGGEAYRMPTDPAGLDALRARPIQEQLALLDAQRHDDPRGLPAQFLREEAAQYLIAGGVHVRVVLDERVRLKAKPDGTELAAVLALRLLQPPWIRQALSEFQHAVDPEHMPVDREKDDERFDASIEWRVFQEQRALADRTTRVDGTLTATGKAEVDAAIRDASAAIDLGLSGEELADALVLRGAALALEGELERAQADIARATELGPANRAAFVAAGGFHAVARRWPDARRCYDRAIELTPDWYWLYTQRAAAEVQLGLRDRYLDDLAHAVSLAPGEVSGRELFGDALSRFREHARAAEQYSEAVRLDPGDTYAWLHRGMAHDALGERRAAIEDYTQVLDHPGDGSRTVAARILRGADELALGDAAASAADFEAGEHGLPRTEGEYVERGMAWSAAGEMARAAADLRQAIALMPDDAVALKDLGATLEKQHDFAGAADAFARSLVSQDDRAVANVLARMRMLAGQFPAAVAAYRAELAAPEPNVYVPLWLYVARIRADVRDEAAARSELRATRLPHDPAPWVDALRDFMLGDIDRAQLMRAADATPATRPGGHRCEADYYGAEILLAHGDRAGARPLLDEAVATCPADYIEAESAVAEQELQAAQGR
jgi:lipoprotein NlpI